VTLVLLALVAPGVHAQRQTRAQRRCLQALDRGGAIVAAAAGSELLGCVDAAIAHRLGRGTLEDCVAGDLHHRIAHARARVSSLAARKCTMRPDFGPASASAVAAAFAGMLDVHALLGPDLDAAITGARGEPHGNACQTAVTRGLVRVADVRLAVFGACAATGLRKGSISAAADLDACHASDPQGRIAHAIRAAGRTAAKRCTGTQTAVVLPGECARAPVAGLFDCVARRAECDVCLAVDAANGVGRSCQRFEDGVARPYCGERPVTTQSVARQWNEETLQAIRLDTPRPTVHARNLFHVAVAMWDAWAVYDSTAVGYLTHDKVVSDDPAADRATAISFAAYRVLAERFARSPGAARSLAAFAARMGRLGYDPTFTTTAGTSAAALGNRIGAAVIAYGLMDGANESGGYADPSYAPVNAPLVVKIPGTIMVDPNRWQPLALDLIVTQNGIPQPDKIQTFIGSQWGGVRPFALEWSDPTKPYVVAGGPPQLGGADDASFKSMNLDVIRRSSGLDPDDGVTMDISPAKHGNNPLGADDGIGYPANPVTGAPYPPNVVRRGDWGRVLAEFWADGPNSETPPGHWNVIANSVSDDERLETRLGGVGPVLDRLEWDVKLYLAVDGAVHDAAIACWGLKRRFDSVRPISAIRYMAGLGQSTDPAGPSYAANGLLLEAGLAEVITPATTGPGQRHEHLAGHVGEIAIHAWPGQPASPGTERAGVQWIRAVEWVPYQKNTFVTPAFAAYPSGHSTFSRAAAEVLTRFTGSPYFPGGLGEIFARRDGFLTFEVGPTADVVLQWVSYFDAADEAGASRRWGGIHIEADDFEGRVIGHQVGIDAFALASRYFAGTIAP
jgi:hypothetical protein